MVPSSLFILASSVCKSLWCLISTLTQWGEGGHLLGSRVQLCCGERETLQTNITGMCGECWQCLGHTGFAPTHSMCAFPVYIAQAPGCSAGELSKASPGLRTLPRSKLFRFSGTPQGHRLSWACVLCPSQVWAAQVTRCLASAHTPGGAVHLITSLVLAALFPSVQWERCLRCAVCLHGELIPGCDPPEGCQLSRIPGRLG